MNLDWLRKEVIGGRTVLDTPYGKRLMTYCDYTASGRNLYFVEDFMNRVGETYANTHTEDSFLGLQTTQLYHEAKNKIKTLCGANDDYVILNVGSGTTAAIQRLSQILGIYEPPTTVSRFGVRDCVRLKESDQCEKIKGPIVFVSKYEHHSNELIWKESLADVVEIDLNVEGRFCLKDLKEKLEDPQYEGRLKIGSFSAASNVTGMYSPIHEIRDLMHSHGGIVFFDYAACGPYVPMKVVEEDGKYMDAIFFSPHKFIGGPGSTGVLILRKELYNSTVGPTCAGGGTVEYVSSTEYDFLDDIEVREDAGTPPILQTIRAAAAMEVKELVGVEIIEETENRYIKEAIKRLEMNPRITLIGPAELKDRLAIVSFNIKYREHFLHPRFVITLLNDLFGIQGRAGCSCAGPYGHFLLGINPEKSDAYRHILLDGEEVMKPGWIRLNFHFLLEKYNFNYVMKAISFISRYGYLFLQEYEAEPLTGRWTHKDFVEKDLLHIDGETITESANRKKYRYSRNLFKKAYRLYIQEAIKHRDRLLEQNGAIKLYGQEKHGDLAWFYVSE